MHKVWVLLKTILIIPIRLFSKTSPFALVKNSNINKLSAISSGCKVYNSSIDRYSYVGKNTIICNTEIGSFCSIAYDCIINPGAHPINMISTSPVFYSKNNLLKKSFGHINFNEYERVRIGDDVWIGARVLVKAGITIGDGAIVGAYSVVTKDVEPYCVVAGNPARVVRKRFDDNEIAALLKMQWWKWDINKLQDKAEEFLDPSKFFNSNV